MKNIKIVLLIGIAFFFCMINVNATTGSVSSNNIIEIDNIIYGYHGKDKHCHIVYEKNGKYYAKQQVDNKYCLQIKKDNPSNNQKNNEKIEVTLSKCIDGDTAEFNVNGKNQRYRFLAIDTEESVSRSKLNTYMGKKASKYTCTLLKDANKIYIEYDKGSTKLDKYNRGLGWIFIDDILLQNKLVKEGYAKVAYLYGDYKYTNILQESEKHAKELNLGIWNEDNLIANIYNFIQKVMKLFT